MVSTRSHLAKRARTESVDDSGDTATQPTRSAPWFDDGNIVLEAESVQFRVYRGILSANSPIFKDMFDLSQPGNMEDVEGCPVVHLLDSPQDLRHVLEIIHDTNKSYFTMKQKLPLGIVAACLRLGTKYEIVHLKAEALRRLYNDFPPTFEHVDHLHFGKNQSIEHYNGIAMDIVRLARENNIPSILPAALYWLCHYSFDTIIHGKRRPDTTISILSTQDQKMCILAKEKLIRLQVVETFGWLNLFDDGVYPGCIGDCAGQKRDIFRQFWLPTPNCSALQPFKQSWAKALCAICAVDSSRKHNAGREKIWNQLPSIFGMRPWVELLDD